MKPAGARPTADQAVPPFPIYHPLQSRTDIFRQGTERISIEIDDAFRQMKPLTIPGEGITLVEARSFAQ